MNLKSAKNVVVILSFILAGCFVTTAKALENDLRIEKEELKELLGNPETVIIDVRVDKHWKESEYKIRGAVRENPKGFPFWVDKYAKEKIIVFY
ncbi:rhodanese-like domain-containing protein [Thermodesulfobacteriota bacterium]